MNLKQSIQQILSEPLTRRQFLVRLAGLALALIGITALLQRAGLRRDETPVSSTPYGGSNNRGRLS